jgi:hypothetical protein
VQKEFYFDNWPQGNVWGCMWTDRTLDQELQACDLEMPARDLFLSYIPIGQDNRRRLVVLADV